MRSGKERIASIADSTVLIKVGIRVPRVWTGLRKCVAIVAMVKSLRRFTFILVFRAGMDRWMPRTVSGCVLYYLVERGPPPTGLVLQRYGDKLEQRRVHSPKTWKLCVRGRARRLTGCSAPLAEAWQLRYLRLHHSDRGSSAGK